MVISIGAGQPGSAWDIGPSQRPASYSLGLVGITGSASLITAAKITTSEVVKRVALDFDGGGLLAVSAVTTVQLTAGSLGAASAAAEIKSTARLTAGSSGAASTAAEIKSTVTAGVPITGVGTLAVVLRKTSRVGLGISGGGVAAVQVLSTESLAGAIGGTGSLAAALVESGSIGLLELQIAGTGSLAVTLAGGIGPPVGHYATVRVTLPDTAVGGLAVKGTTVLLRSASTSTTHQTTSPLGSGGITAHPALVFYRPPEPLIVGIPEE